MSGITGGQVVLHFVLEATLNVGQHCLSPLFLKTPYFILIALLECLSPLFDDVANFLIHPGFVVGVGLKVFDYSEIKGIKNC